MKTATTKTICCYTQQTQSRSVIFQNRIRELSFPGEDSLSQMFAWGWYYCFMLPAQCAYGNT